MVIPLSELEQRARALEYADTTHDVGSLLHDLIAHLRGSEGDVDKRIAAAVAAERSRVFDECGVACADVETVAHGDAAKGTARECLRRIAAIRARGEQKTSGTSGSAAADGSSDTSAKTADTTSRAAEGQDSRASTQAVATRLQNAIDAGHSGHPSTCPACVVSATHIEHEDGTRTKLHEPSDLDVQLQSIIGVWMGDLRGTEGLAADLGIFVRAERARARRERTSEVRDMILTLIEHRRPMDLATEVTQSLSVQLSELSDEIRALAGEEKEGA